MIACTKPHGHDEALRPKRVLAISTPTVHRYFEASIIMYPSTRNSVMINFSNLDHQQDVSSNKKPLFMLGYCTQ